MAAEQPGQTLLQETDQENWNVQIETADFIEYMADHAGGRRSMVNPRTKLWRPPVEVTQFWRPFLFL